MIMLLLSEKSRFTLCYFTSNMENPCQTWNSRNEISLVQPMDGQKHTPWAMGEALALAHL